MSYQKLLAILYHLCLMEKTGSLFITVTGNISATIVLRHGVITACFYCHEQGLVAIKNIKQFKLVQYVFSEQILFSMQSHSDLPATSQILYLLGYEVPENSPLLRREFETSKCYRGATVLGEDAKRGVKPTQTIYRGSTAVNEELDKNQQVNPKLHTYRGQNY